MLQELRIHNIAIIEDLSLEFSAGLTVVTGETGAGKSVIADAVSLLAGLAKPGDRVRQDEDMGFVEGLFDLQEMPAAKAALAQMGIRVEADDLLVLRRELRTAGRDRVLINGLTSSLALLQRAGALLLHIQSQDMQRRLSHPHFATDFLDRWQQNQPEISAVAAARQRFLAKNKTLAILQQEQDLAREQLGLWQYQEQELREADLDPDEEELLRERINFGRNARRLLEAAGQARALLDDTDPSARNILGMVLGDLGRVCGDSVRLQEVVGLVAGAEKAVGEASQLLERYLDTCEVDPAQLDVMEQRKALYEDLQRKYNRDCRGLIAYAATLVERLGRQENASDDLEALTAEVQEARAELQELALVLRSKRRQGTGVLAEKLEHVLRPLGMKDIEVSLALVPNLDDQGPLVLEGEACSVTDRGCESVELMVRTNPGEGVGPAHRIASGGERSRIFLGVAVLDAGASEPPLLLFDEIDAGLGMEGAAPVATLLEALAQRGQVLCITHLATVAAKGRQHLKVTKQSHGKRTVTLAHYLDGDQRVAELTRLLGGADILDDSGHQVAFARKLFEQGANRTGRS